MREREEGERKERSARQGTEKANGYIDSWKTTREFLDGQKEFVTWTHRLVAKVCRWEAEMPTELKPVEP